MRHVVILALGILLVAVMLESPSYTLATLWKGDNPWEELPETTSKDARVGTLSLHFRRLVLKCSTH